MYNGGILEKWFWPWRHIQTARTLEWCKNLVIQGAEEERSDQLMSNDPQPHAPRQSDQIAKPFAKVTATVNNRRTGDTATKQENVVWNPEEVKDFVVEKDEKRPRPEFEVVYTYWGHLQAKGRNWRCLLRFEWAGPFINQMPSDSCQN